MQIRLSSDRLVCRWHFDEQCDHRQRASCSHSSTKFLSPHPHARPQNWIGSSRWTTSQCMSHPIGQCPMILFTKHCLGSQKIEGVIVNRQAFRDKKIESWMDSSSCRLSLVAKAVHGKLLGLEVLEQYGYRFIWISIGFAIWVACCRSSHAVSCWSSVREVQWSASQDLVTHSERFPASLTATWCLHKSSTAQMKTLKLRSAMNLIIAC